MPEQVCYEKPRAVSAWQFTRDEGDEVADWCGGDIVEVDGSNPYLIVPSSAGSRRAELSDYVIRIGTSFLVCPEDIFARHYEMVDANPTAVD